MKRFRLRRKRLAALALLSATAAIMTTGWIGPASAADGGQARIDASQSTVRYGDRVAIKGRFPGSPNAPVKINYRPQGSKVSRVVRTVRTGDEGRYRGVVKPLKTGVFRARVVQPDQPQGDISGVDGGARAPVVDTRTGKQAVRVRSKVRSRVTQKHLTVGETTRVKGAVQPTDAGRKVVVQIGGRRVTTRTNGHGRFSVRADAGSTGTHRVRVKARGNGIAAGSVDRAGRVTVYRPAAASWYGPGFYGNTTACGQTLTTGTLGVAHKTMPCGTKLRLRYGNRTVAVRVIDRGPYSGNREFDLTYATKQRLGFGSTGTVLTSR